MACFPEVQKKAQDEIDRIVGSGRLPTMADESQLPYIRAMIKETLRWMPTTVTGAVPHAATKDDEYMGHFIPQGAGIMLNVWAIHMDETRHPNPREFHPERYENDNQTAADSAANPDASQRDHSRLDLADGFVRGCMSRNGHCSWECQGCFGGSILRQK
jgi:cytochrome P450